MTYDSYDSTYIVHVRISVSEGLVVAIVCSGFEVAVVGCIEAGGGVHLFLFL
jgi:hypothetical protein